MKRQDLLAKPTTPKTNNELEKNDNDEC